MESKRIGGTRYFVAGEGRPLVLVHGLGGWAGNWQPLVDRLEGDFRLVVPELAGHGGSEPFHGARTLEPFVDAIFEVLEHEDAVPAPWVGHSLGALVGEWDPQDFENEYRRDLRAMLDAKLSGEQIARPEPVAETPVIDLMEALRRSVAEVQTAKKPKAASKGGSRKKAAAK